MNIHLKVKICTLAAESKIIRAVQRNLTKRAGKSPESLIFSKLGVSPPKDDNIYNEAMRLRLERKRYKAKLAIIKMGQKPLDLWPSLQHHRKTIVRNAARNALIAYGFLRNRPYAALEHKCYFEPNWKEVEKNILRFTTEKDPRIVLQRFEEWKQRGRQDQDRYKSGEKATQSSSDQTRLSA